MECIGQSVRDTCDPIKISRHVIEILAQGREIRGETMFKEIIAQVKKNTDY